RYDILHVFRHLKGFFRIIFIVVYGYRITGLVKKTFLVFGIPAFVYFPYKLIRLTSLLIKITLVIILYLKKQFCGTCGIPFTYYVKYFFIFTNGIFNLKGGIPGVYKTVMDSEFKILACRKGVLRINITYCK